MEQSIPLYPNTCTEIFEGLRGVLASIVESRCLDLSPRLVLHKSFELMEDLVLGLHEVDSCLPGMVIDEGDVVLIPTQGW